MSDGGGSSSLQDAEQEACIYRVPIEMAK